MGNCIRRSEPLVIHTKIETMPDAPIKIDLSGDGGVLKDMIREGTGDERPHDGCKVSLNYTGTLVDGSVFVETNRPYEFELGKGQAIQAFEIFIPTMRREEKSVLTCTANYAYGPAGDPPNIPGNATLRFELELLNWKPEDLSLKSDGGIIRYVITPTTTKETLNEGVLVEVHLIGKFEDRVFDERDVSLEIGVTDDEVISGVQTALQKFGKDETSRLMIKPEYAFGNGHKKWNIPANATVEYTVSIKNVEKKAEALKRKAEALKSKAEALKRSIKIQKSLQKENQTLRRQLYASCRNEALQEPVVVTGGLKYCLIKKDEDIKKQSEQ